MPRDRAAKAAYMRAWRAKPENAEKHRQWSRNWAAANPAKAKAAARKQYEANRALFISRSKKWREDNPGQAARLMYYSHLKTVFNLSPERFDLMLIEQAGKCAICRVPMLVPCVDHDHACCPMKGPRGRNSSSCGACVRGLLCHRCNTGLANFRDKPEMLESAVAYLRKFTW